MHQRSARTIWLVVGVMGAAVASFAQEPAMVIPPPADAPTIIGVPPVATKRQLLQKYVWSTLGVDGAIHATLTSGFDQWRDNPPTWSPEGTGYSRRWTSEYAESAIGDTAKYSVARIFHHDPGFARCECTGFRRRLRHALDSPFMARKRDGTRVLSGASLAGVLAGRLVSSTTWYPVPGGARNGLKHAGISLATKMGVDVFKEFRPRRSQ